MADQNHTNTSVHFEHRDVNVRSMAWIIAAIVVTAAVLHVVLYFMYTDFRSGFAECGRVPKSLEQAGQRNTGRPKLQVDPATDINRLREDENKKLSSYGWIDKDKGVIRIPIKDAIRLVAERGLGSTATANSSSASRAAAEQPDPTQK